MITTIKDFRTIPKIAQRLQLKQKEVSDILEFLCTNGLAEKKHNEYLSLQKNIHIGLQSPFTPQRQTGIRLQAIEKFDSKKEESVHYSLVFTCSKADLLLVKKKLHQCIVDCNEVIRPSPEETLGTMCIDLFEM